MQIIGLTGKKGHGKTQFCEFLGQRLPGRIQYINFKAPLLEMARDIGWDGKKDIRGRRLLQRLGTDVVRECMEKRCTLQELSLNSYQRYSPLFDRDLYRLLNVETSLKSKRSRGSTGPREVERALKSWERKLSRASARTSR